MKKFTIIWTLSGLSICGKVTIVKSLLVPKLVYMSLLLPTPLHIIKQVNHTICTFLWKGKDKVTGLSAIDNFEGDGIKLVVMETWLKRILNDNESTWKFCLMRLLKFFKGFFIFDCNYAMKDPQIASVFYRELLK
ncbi:hypothetical protein pdam_00022840 [Pocillopora damicornis]|uniref:Reverse transcriptase domain-containing protein n=1 Tax=Pocillopora damicornis TaxID=46731 RepID=A0A3M6T485_POCDA|nr:hypothetical protein pdam_00022840 [Pocillopora damicornis]